MPEGREVGDEDEPARGRGLGLPRGHGHGLGAWSRAVSRGVSWGVVSGPASPGGSAQLWLDYEVGA